MGGRGKQATLTTQESEWMSGENDKSHEDLSTAVSSRDITSITTLLLPFTLIPILHSCMKQPDDVMQCAIL
jgi:hypothetical protein